MRVAEDSPSRLVLVHRPWLAGLGLVVATAVVAGVAWSLWQDGDLPGAAMIGAGVPLCLAGLWAFVRPARLVLDRQAGLAEFREITLFGPHRRSVALAEVAGAAVRRGRDTMVTGAAKGSRAVLTLRDGTAFPLAPAHMGHRPAARAAAAVTRWIER